MEILYDLVEQENLLNFMMKHVLPMKGCHAHEISSYLELFFIIQSYTLFTYLPHCLHHVTLQLLCQPSGRVGS